MNSSRQLIVADFLADIGRARPEDEIMAKYRISSKELNTLRNKMLRVGLVELTHTGWIVAQKRKVPTQDIIKDLRSGASCETLMRRYLLHKDYLAAILTKLVEKGLVGKQETLHVLGSDPAAAEYPQRRRASRVCPFMGLTIRNRADHTIQGKIRDISLTGVGIEDIVSYPGEAIGFEVLLEEFGAVKPLSFDAICRWYEFDQRVGVDAAGFEITCVYDGGIDSLQEVIETTTFSMAL